jgi:hypothetical protein
MGAQDGNPGGALAEIDHRLARYVIDNPGTCASVAGFASRSEIDSLRRHKPHDPLSTKRGQAHERLCRAGQEGQFGISATLAPCRR